MDQPVCYRLVKNTSAFYRMTQRYMNEHLKAYDLGSGQQFFLDRIARNPGISLQELAQLGYFDNGTATRAVQKLEEKGLVSVTTDEKDRRIRRLNLTEAGEPVVQAMRQLKSQWRDVVTENFTDEEKLLFRQLLDRLVDNAQNYLSRQEKQEGES